MSTITKRILSLVLSFVMLIGMLPINVLAEDNAEGMPPVSVVDAAADGNTEGSPVNTDGTEQNPEVILDENQENPDVNPGEGQENPGEGQENPGEGQENPGEGQENPGEGQENPGEGQENPGEGQENPGEDQDNPDENVGDTEEDAEDTEGTENTEDTEEETEETEDDVEELETDESEEEALLSLVRDGKKLLAVVYAASDFQPDDDDFEAAQGVMKNIIAQMKAAGYTDVDGALICGDYSNIGDTWNTNETNADIYNNPGLAAMANVLGSTEYGWGLESKLNELDNLVDDESNSGDDVVYIQGNHDPDDTEGLDKFGAHDTEYYGVFAIHEDNFQWRQAGTNSSGNSTDAKQAAMDTAEKLATYLQGKVDAKDNRPIFVMSHVPLHFGSRTTKSGEKDNVYAQYLFDVLNEYGEKLNIIFLFGHNHSSTYDDYIGGAAVYLPAGVSINIPDKNNTSTYKSHTLKFTYMNAGYLGYYGGACEPTDLSSTVFAIYEDAVVVARYGESGPTNLKDEGEKDSSGCSQNSTVYTNDSEQATIPLKKFNVDMDYSAVSTGYMAVGTESTLTLKGMCNYGYQVNWTSSDPSVIAVAPSGDGMSATLTAGNQGTARITAEVYEGGYSVATLSADDVSAVAEAANYTFSYDITVVTDTSSIPQQLLPAGSFTYFKKVDNYTLGETYMIVDMENDGPVIGQHQALELNRKPDYDKEQDATYSNGEHDIQELNASGQDVIQLPIDGSAQTLILNSNRPNIEWEINGKSQDFYIRTLNTDANNNKDDNSTYQKYLSASEGDTTGVKYTDYYKSDADHDQLRMYHHGGKNGGDSWMWDSDIGLYTWEKGDGFNYVLYYSQAQTDFSTYRYDVDGDTGLLTETADSRVYLFEKTTVTLNEPITAKLSGITGYVNKDVGYTDDEGLRRGGAQTGDEIIITNGTQTSKVPVTIDMLTGDFDVTTPGTYDNLTVTYAGVALVQNYTLVVNDTATLLKNSAGREYMDTIYTLVDEMQPNKQYLIVDRAQEGIGHAIGMLDNDNASAHNVRVHQLPVDGQELLLIDSSRYSSTADPIGTNLVGRGIVPQGNINAFLYDTVSGGSSNATIAAYKSAINLVWSATQRAFPYAVYSSGTEYYDVYDKTYFFLEHEYLNEYLKQYYSADAEDLTLELYTIPNVGNKGKWTYDTATGLHLKTSNYSHAYLFYNWQNVDAGSSTSNAANKNFQTEEAADGNYELTDVRRTWIYERVTNIDTISARVSDDYATVEQYVDKRNEVTNIGTLLDDYILVETLHANGKTTTKQVPMDISMLSGDYDIATVGTYHGLTVTYQGIEICDDYTLDVVEFTPEGDQRNYPEFPKEGAVRINKQLDTTKYDYNRTGMANIDLSVTGIPARTPVDLVVILDASSSMSDCVHGVDFGKSCDTCGNVVESVTRMAQMENTLETMLTQLKTPINGKTPDIDVAVATFNGYTVMNSSYELWYEGCGPTHEIGQEANEDKPDASKVLMEFTPIASINPKTKFNPSVNMDTQINRGTNYDRGMELAYELLSAKQAENSAKGVARDAVVVFMSDGAPYQFNYIQGDPNMAYWDDYFSGNETDALANAVSQQPAVVQAMYNEYNGHGKHWIAEAIKAPITSDNNKMIDPNANTENQIVNVRGLGATLYTVGYGLADDLKVQKNACIAVLQNMATTPEHFILADNNNDLQSAFTRIAGDVLSAGDAVFKDQMGPKFNLVTSSKVKYLDSSEKITEVDTTATDSPVAEPTITVKQYQLYKSGDVNGTTVTSGMVGTRKNTTPEMLETVTFNSDGTAAYSDQKSGNILEDKVIKAKYFFYNTDEVNAKTITLSDGTTIQLEPETFYWNIGQVPEEELVLSYTVYLEESMGGEREAGNYPTNNFAKLTYTNYLGNDCELSAPTPVLPWQSGSVGYAFYLVNADGEPIINQTENLTGSFENSVKITSPVNIEFMLNSNGVTIQSIKAEEVLPEGYELFDSAAEYTVTLFSDGTGTYGVTGNKAIPTTYVEGVAPTATKVTSASVSADSFATANTTVWFAVKATTNCVPDTVVIDYALPVAIDVLANDVMMGENATLQYVRATTSGEGSDLWESFKDKCDTNGADFVSASATGKYGEAAVVAGDHGHNKKILYTLNGMEMDKEDTFVYAVNYTGDVGGKGYYYSTVTVIPATSIYYEDSFVTYSVFTNDGTPYPNIWQKVEDKKISANQAQDRPGEFSLSNIDANNIYGYDGAYENMATYSMGSAQMITVNANRYAEAKFTFNGTGFDIISLTSNTTGTIVVSVKSNDVGNDTKENYMVDTYYGYKYALCNVTYEYDIDKNYPGENKGVWIKHVMGEVSADVTEERPAVKPENPQEGDTVSGVEMTWIADNTAKDSLYQVPVIKVKDLPYGNYTATITVSYLDALDHNKEKSGYDFYLDAIRIYDPANDGTGNDTIKDAYVADGEGWPEYFELRNLIISRNDFNSLTNGEGSGIVFIDNTQDSEKNQSYTIEDYTNYGPNNELYLAPGQSVAFHLSVTDPALDQIHIAMKSVGNGTAYVKYYDAGATTAEKTVAEEIATATDLYYNITALNRKNVVITNSGDSSDAILSITNIKVTYKSEHEDSIESNFFTTTQQLAEVAVASLMRMARPPVTPEEPEVPESSEPTPSEPENSEPDESIPEVEPEVFEPKHFDVRLSKNSVKVGQKVTVTVTTGKDVAYITVNGSEVTKYSGRRFGNTRTWQLQVEAKEAGELDVAVVCYNRDKLASAPVVKTVKVADKKAFEPKRFDVRLSDTSVKAGSKVTVTVTTSKDVEYITVNGSKVTRYSGSRFSNTRTWQVRVNAKDVGEMDVTVVCYNRDKVASAPVVKTVTVTKKYTNIYNPMKDYFTGYFDKFWGRR